MGWMDCRLLTEAVERAVRCGGEIGSVTWLRHYDTTAQRLNVPTMVAIDWLNRLYRTQAGPIVLARSLGLNFVNPFSLSRTSSFTLSLTTQPLLALRQLPLLLIL